jgi:hypothetical protein
MGQDVGGLYVYAEKTHDADDDGEKRDIVVSLCIM